MKRSSVVILFSTKTGLAQLGGIFNLGPMKSGPAEEEARRIAFVHLRKIDTVRIIMVDRPGRRLIIVAGKEKW